MNLWAAFRTALHALLKNTLRSVLATLGIVIAVAAVVGTVSLGEGARAKVEAEMSSMGVNVVYLYSGSTNRKGISSGAGAGQSLTIDDGEAIARDLSQLVRAVAPVSRTNAQIVYRDANWATMVIGTTASYLEVRQWTLGRGDFFGREEDAAAAKVCVLGSTVADKLFGGGPAVGELIRVKHLTCRVVGVLATKGQGGWGQDQDDVILMPWRTLTRRLTNMGDKQGLSFMISARTTELAGELQERMTALIRERHHVADGAEDDFSIFNMSEMQEAAKEQTRTLSLFLAAVALISLVVGAIGIANVMLVSVTERTREIGIRMAVGARSRDILLQFLTEALVLSSVGGLIGLALGAGLAQYMGSKGDWPVLLSFGVMAMTLALAASAGILAGFYPALRASRLDPIEALRYE